MVQQWAAPSSREARARARARAKSCAWLILQDPSVIDALLDTAEQAAQQEGQEGSDKRSHPYTLATKLAQLNTACRSIIHEWWKNCSKVSIVSSSIVTFDGDQLAHVNHKPVLSFIARRCPALQRLQTCLSPAAGQIGGMCHPGRALKVDDGMLLPVAKACRMLTTLNVGHSLITDRAVWAIAAGCPCLSRLSLAGCKRVTLGSLEALGSTMRELAVDDCVFRIDDAVLHGLSGRCPQLKSLSAEGLPSFQVNLGTLSLHHLEFLTVEGTGELICNALNGHVEVTRMVQEGLLPPLAMQMLSLSRTEAMHRPQPIFTLALAQVLAHRCPHLRYLDVSEWDGFEAASLATLLAAHTIEDLQIDCTPLCAADFAAIASCASLVKCSVCNSDATDEFVVALAENVPRLTYLSLYAGEVSDVAMHALCDGACHAHLREVDLAYCGRVCYQAGVRLALCCPDLLSMGHEHADLCDKNYTEECKRRLASSPPHDTFLVCPRLLGSAGLMPASVWTWPPANSESPCGAAAGQPACACNVGPPWCDCGDVSCGRAADGLINFPDLDCEGGESWPLGAILMLRKLFGERALRLGPASNGRWSWPVALQRDW